jgi:hypothetical protein
VLDVFDQVEKVRKLTPEELRQDKAFMSANLNDERAYLSSIDKEFATAKTEDQNVSGKP